LLTRGLSVPGMPGLHLWDCPPGHRGTGPPAGRRLAALLRAAWLRIVAAVENEFPGQTDGAPRRLEPAPAQIARPVLLGPVAPRTWRAAANLMASLVVGAPFLIALLAGLGFSLLVSRMVVVGRRALSFTLAMTVEMARLDRRRIKHLAAAQILPLPVSAHAPGLSWREQREAREQSPGIWRLVNYQLVRLPVVVASVAAVAVIITAMVAELVPSKLDEFERVTSSNYWVHAQVGAFNLLVAIACFFAWPAAVRLGSALDVALARAMLGPSRTGQLSAEVQRLGEARALALESAESERRRIERDLHDGLQPRLVSLALVLGLAQTRFEPDPAAARSLLDQAHREAKTVIADLRGLVRGIHPSVLDERGLDAALSALVASCAVPVRVEVSLDHRPGRASEAVAYFVAAEAITNVTKHAGASAASVTIARDADALRVVIRDDGRGGAHPEPGGGLAGLAARVTAIDGSLTVTSPPGGPTCIEAVIPCGR
jgi:signal transduction histidine kinase